MDGGPASSHDLRRLQARAQQLLSQDDYEYLNYVLNEYWQYRNVDGLVMCLLSVLDTPSKLDLLNGVRDVIDEKDVERFDVVAPFKKMANPPLHAKQARPHSHVAAQDGHTRGPVSQQRETVRQVTLNRSGGNRSLGFSIFGGREQNMGIFVSGVDTGSLAEQSGLRVGDRILDVNGMNFEHVAHSTAVKVLKSPGRIVMVVKPARRPAGGRVTQLRVEENDRSRRARSNPDVAGSLGMLPRQQGGHSRQPGTADQGQAGSDLESQASVHALSELRMGGGSIDVRKVNLPVEPGQPIGIAIRGGKEHNVGIFISHVEERSLAARNGLQLGDQILDVNGVKFLDITHTEAIMTLKKSPVLMMTVKAMGRIPMAGRSTDGQLQWLEPTVNNDEDELEPGQHSPSLRVAPRAATPELRRQVSKEAIAPESPRKESKTRRFQDILKGSSAHDNGPDGESPIKRQGGRQRSMTLPNRRSQSLTKADYKDGYVPHQTRTKSQSRNSDDDDDDDDVDYEDDDEAYSVEREGKSRRGTLGGLTAAIVAGQRFVSSMRRKGASSSASPPDGDEPPLQPVPNNQKPKPSPVPAPRRPSAPTTAQPLPTPSPKLSRQDGDGSDASDTKRTDQSRLPGGSSPFFSRGLGSQVMLTSMAAQASKQAQQVLQQSAANCMTDAECGALRLHLKRYEEDQNIVDLVTALLPLLNTPRKMELLQDIRSLVNVQHIKSFEELVSKREMEALKDRNRARPAVGPGAEAKDTKEAAPRSPEHGQLFSAIQSGRPQLRKVVSSPSRMDNSPATVTRKSSGMFQSTAAQRMLERGRSVHEEVEEQRVRRKDSFVAWGDAHEGIRKRGSQKRHSFATEILLELAKTKSTLGMSIEGGTDTKQQEVRISSIIEGGLAAEDGFLQAGFEIVSVDGQAIKGCTHAEAVERISAAFGSERDSLELVVIPEVD